MIVKSDDKFGRTNAVAVGVISRIKKSTYILKRDAVKNGYIYFLMHVNMTAKRKEDGSFGDKEYEDVILKINTKSISYNSALRLRVGMHVFACGKLNEFNDTGDRELDSHTFLLAEYFVIIEEQLENFIVFTNEKKHIAKKKRKAVINEYVSRAADEETRKEIEEIIAQHDDRIMTKKSHEEIMMRTNFNDDYTDDDYDF